MRESTRKRRYYKKKFDKIEQQLSSISLSQKKIEKAKRYIIFS